MRGILECSNRSNPGISGRQGLIPILKTILSFLLAVVLAPGSRAATVQDVVNQVNQERYRAYHNAVEDCGLGLYGGSAYDNGSRSRYWGPNKGNLEAQLYIRDMFLQNPRLVVTSPSGLYQNVVAELPGLDPARKDDVYVISGHFDTTGTTNRPGGDDNASGTAGVLEAAKVMSQYYFGATIRFVAFNAEEGLHGGSLDYVASLSLAERARTKNLNMDMIIHGRDDRSGHTSDPYDIDLWTSLTDPAQLEWMQTFREAASTYAPGLKVDLSPDDRGSSDHQSFYLAGIPAFTLIEFDVPAWNGGANGEYHTSRDFRFYQPSGSAYLQDTHWSYPFATDVIRACVATIAQEAGLAPPLLGVEVTDQNGTSAVVRWRTALPGTSRVEYGLSPQYGSSTVLNPAQVTEHAVALTSLAPGQEYHLRVISVTSEGEQVSEDFTFSTLKRPFIYNVWVSENTGTSAKVRWQTDAPSSSRVEYGSSPSYGVLLNMDPTLVTEHEYTVSNLNPGSAYHFRVLSSNGAGTAVSGDYVMTAALPVGDIIVDNSDAGFSILQGSWTSGAISTRIGPDYLYAAGTGSQLESSVSARCRWTPTVAIPGYYDVFAYIQRGTNRSLEAPYTISYSGGTRKSYSSHYLASAGSVWHAIAGALPFAAGTSGYVELANNTPDTNLVSADAVKLVFAAPLDVTAPPAPGVSFDRPFAAPGEIVRAFWPVDDLDSGIAEYEYRVRDGQGNVLKVWTGTANVSAVVSGAAAGMSLFVDARARNGAGLWSPVGTGGPLLILEPQGCLNCAKQMAPGSQVVLKPMVVTANLGDYLYIQSPSEYSALRVNAYSALPPGAVVSASGVIASTGGEMMLSGAGLGLLATPASVKPLGISAMSVGGVDVSDNWRGVSNGWGPNNVGLLIRVNGRVTRSEGPESYFYLMDDCETTDSTGLGIRVNSGSWAKPGVGQLVRVTGISHFRDDAGQRAPELLLQQSGAFEVLN